MQSYARLVKVKVELIETAYIIIYIRIRARKERKYATGLAEKDEKSDEIRSKRDEDGEEGKKAQNGRRMRA